MYFYNNCDSDDMSKCAFHNQAVECGEFLDDQGLNETAIEDFFNSSSVPNSDNIISLMYPSQSVHWTLYVDPITSLILTMLILFTTLKLLRGNEIHITQQPKSLLHEEIIVYAQICHPR